MAFTYTGDLGTNLDKVRFHLQDTVSGSGPKPADGNFTDAELAGLITAEGTYQQAVAAGFEALAVAWRKHVSFTADGLQLARSDIAKGYADQATAWRKLYGSAGISGGAGYRAVTRVDGYSSDVDNQTT